METFHDGKPDQRSFARPETILQVDDHVVTGEESSAILNFSDNSTLLLKEESEIVLQAKPSGDSKVDLVAGRIWVNVKHMLEGESLEVRMNQCVTGIKGTNITCGSDLQRNEDQVQVLRGTAEVEVLATRQKVLLEAGEELRVGPGGRAEKTAIDVPAEANKWQGELTHLGDAIGLDEAPDLLQRLSAAQGATFRSLQAQHSGLAANPSPKEEEIQSFRKEAERFIGQIVENDFILAGLSQRVEKAALDDAADSTRKATLLSLGRQITRVKSETGGIQEETQKWLRGFSRGMAPASELEPLALQMATGWGIVEKLIQELRGRASGSPQAWFQDAYDQAGQAAKEFGLLGEQLQALSVRYPQDPQIGQMLKRLAAYEAETGRFLREVSVITIDTEILARMQDLEETVSTGISLLRTDLDTYDALAPGLVAEGRLQASLRILRQFSQLKRRFDESQRLYQSATRPISTRNILTTEQEQLREMFDRLKDSFQQLGDMGDELERLHQDLQGGLGPLLK